MSKYKINNYNSYRKQENQMNYYPQFQGIRVAN